LGTSGGAEAVAVVVVVAAALAAVVAVARVAIVAGTGGALVAVVVELCDEPPQAARPRHVPIATSDERSLIARY
jgi:hypothetical protein